MADDNLVNQRVAQAMLLNLGHRVDIVGDGEQAVRAVLAADYDVILMDVHTPVMDGLDDASPLTTSAISLNAALMTGRGAGRPGRRER